jgi:predicted amidohydrolase YtcJ
MEAGKNADIAVWDQNPYAIATQEIQHLHCVLTLFEGTVVYEAN